MARIVNHSHGDFLRLTAFLTTGKTLGIADCNMGRDVVDSVNDVLRHIILTRSLVEQVAEWILIQHY